MDALQRAVPIPQHEIRMRGALRRQILRQGLPLAACREHIEDRVQNLADVHLAPAPTAFGWRYRRLDQRPLAVAQITRVAQTMAVDSPAVFRLPHSAPLSSDAGAKEGITTDSSDSTTLWIGSKDRSELPIGNSVMRHCWCRTAASCVNMPAKASAVAGDSSRSSASARVGVGASAGIALYLAHVAQEKH